jgi:hypothetical protein
MAEKVNRQTVDLSGFPDLVVIYLGMKVRTPRGLKTLMTFGPRISRAVAEKPDGLLRHEFMLFSLFPLHLGMRQYWRNFETLENWSRSLPHQQWWKEFLGDSGGTGFWHETYFMRGGMEAIYDDVGSKFGLLQFAPSSTARGPMFSARKRVGIPGESALTTPVSESEVEK